MRATPIRLRTAILAACVSALGVGPAVAQRGSNKPAAPRRSMGLLMSTEQQLLGIPLASPPYSGTELPARTDLTANMPPPGSQGNQNSCVGWAVAYALKSYQEKVEQGGSLVRGGHPDPNRVFSPAFIYNQINNGRDGGSRFTDALNLLTDRGAATWASMPYDPTDYKSRPGAAALQNARQYRVQTWRRVNLADTREVKAQLAAGYPIIAGVRVDLSFQNAKRGFVWRKSSGESLGGHAILLSGYDDRKNAYQLINSWGQGWGDQGYGWIDYDHFRRVASEAFVAKDAINGPPPATPAPTPRPTPTQERRTPVSPRRNWTPPPPVRTPARNVARTTQFSITNVQHNVSYPNNPAAGQFLRFDGLLAIPPGAGRNDQVVIHFFADAGNGTKGQPVGSVMAEYRTVTGQAACGTAVYPIPREGIVPGTTWGAWIPYNAFRLYSGQWVQGPAGPYYQPYTSNMVAEPMLYIDNFNVACGGLFRFYVQR